MHGLVNEVFAGYEDLRVHALAELADQLGLLSATALGIRLDLAKKEATRVEAEVGCHDLYIQRTTKIDG